MYYNLNGLEPTYFHLPSENLIWVGFFPSPVPWDQPPPPSLEIKTPV